MDETTFRGTNPAIQGTYAATPEMPREVFSTGAQRSATTAGGDKPTDYSQFSHVAARLHAETQAEGNEKYGYGNWQKGIPVSNLLSHALAHIFALLNGDVSENHLGHAIWNLDKAAHFIETKPELVDMVPLRIALKLDDPPGYENHLAESGHVCGCGHSLGTHSASTNRCLVCGCAKFSVADSSK